MGSKRPDFGDGASSGKIFIGGLSRETTLGSRPMYDSRLSYLRDLCDKYFDPRDCDPGAGSTSFHDDGIEYVNDLAELALKFYNEKEQKNFYLEKVGKLNVFVVSYCLTFWARNAETDERRIFRCVVDAMLGNVLLCEMKDGDEIEIPANHLEYRRLRRSWIDDYLATVSAGGSVDASSGAAVDHGGVDLGLVDGSHVA